MGSDRPLLLFLAATVLAGILATAPSGRAAPVADHTGVEQFAAIPDSTLDSIRARQSLLYGHTSHGSQPVTGMQMLLAELGASYELPALQEVSGDLGHQGSLAWEATTRTLLGQPNDYTLVMWSWCGGASDNTDEGIDTYLAAMDALEADFPEIRFVYMTGHLDGTGDDGLLRHNNDRIRDYCRENDKILYDFADIESWDPDGVRYPDESDACAWCADWCATHECPDCSNCAHSHCFNCYRKGKALWWLLAQLEGWIPLEGTTHSLDGVKALFR